MSKGFKYSIIGAAVIVVLGFLLLTLSLDYLVKTAIEDTGTEMTQTGVTVESVSISLFSGEGSIEGLRVKNPEGFENEYAVVMQRFDIGLDVGSLLTDTLIINEILITGPDLSVIQKVPENNLRMLMKNINASVGEESSSSGGMIIERLLVQNGQVTVIPNIGGTGSATITMGTIELENVGRQGSSSVKQVIEQVSSRILNEAIQAAVSGQLEGLKDRAKDAVKDIFN